MRCYSNDEVISRVKKHLESKENCQPLVDDVSSYNYNYGKGYSYDATFEPLERSWLVIATPREFLSEIFRWRYYEESDSVVSVDIQDEQAEHFTGLLVQPRTSDIRWDFC